MKVDLVIILIIGALLSCKDKSVIDISNKNKKNDSEHQLSSNNTRLIANGMEYEVVRKSLLKDFNDLGKNLQIGFTKDFISNKNDYITATHKSGKFSLAIFWSNDKIYGIQYYNSKQDHRKIDNNFIYLKEISFDLNGNILSYIKDEKYTNITDEKNTYDFYEELEKLKKESTE